MTNDDTGTLESKVDALLSLVQSQPKKNSAREIWLIVITAIVTLVSTTFGQGALSFYSHWQDRRAQLAQLQINTLINSADLNKGGFLGDVQELANEHNLSLSGKYEI